MNDKEGIILNQINDNFILSYSDDLIYISHLYNIYQSHPFASVSPFSSGFIFRTAVISTVGNIETILAKWNSRLSATEFTENEFLSLKLFSGGSLETVNGKINSIKKITKCRSEDISILKNYFAIKNLRNAIIHHDLSQNKINILDSVGFTTDIFNGDGLENINKVIEVNRSLTSFINAFYIKKMYGHKFFEKYGSDLLSYHSQTKFEWHLDLYLQTKGDVWPDVDWVSPDIPVVYYKKDIFRFFNSALSRIYGASRVSQDVTKNYLSSASYILKQFSNLAFEDMNDANYEYYYEKWHKIIYTDENTPLRTSLSADIELLNFSEKVYSIIPNITFIELTRLLAKHSSSNTILIEKKHIVLCLAWLGRLVSHGNDYEDLIKEMITLVPKNNN